MGSLGCCRALKRHTTGPWRRDYYILGRHVNTSYVQPSPALYLWLYPCLVRVVCGYVGLRVYALRRRLQQPTTHTHTHNGYWCLPHRQERDGVPSVLLRVLGQNGMGREGDTSVMGD
jgi:hypothetical protein